MVGPTLEVAMSVCDGNIVIFGTSAIEVEVSIERLDRVEQGAGSRLSASLVQQHRNGGGLSGIDGIYTGGECSRFR